VQNDIKRVIAYSTMSQLGYMFVAAGVGVYSVAMFHLFTHAFFKAMLFLGAGSVIHAMHHEQDMRNYGGLRKKIPYTFWAMLIGTLAITGVGIPLTYYRLCRVPVEGRGHRKRLGSGRPSPSGCWSSRPA
jgi:NADH-quinone oxidoreductase subunit L